MPDVMDNFSINGFWTMRQPWIILGFAIVAPLSCFHNLDALKYTSGLAVVFVLFLMCLVFAYSLPDVGLDACGDDHDCRGDMPLFALSGGTLRVLSIFIFAFSCQTVSGTAPAVEIAYSVVFFCRLILTVISPAAYHFTTLLQNIFAVVNELRNPTQRRIDSVSTASVFSSLVVYTVVALAGYYTYGDEVDSNILISYPSKHCRLRPVFSTPKNVTDVLCVYVDRDRSHKCRANLRVSAGGLLLPHPSPTWEELHPGALEGYGLR